MAIFSAKKNTVKKEKKVTVPSESIIREMGPLFENTPRSYAGVLLHPRVTEKASMQSENGIYTFNVDSKATKNDIKSAVRALFKVSPVKVAIVNVRSKEILARGKKGRTAQGKKAYVYLKKGDKIEFV